MPIYEVLARWTEPGSDGGVDDYESIGFYETPSLRKMKEVFSNSNTGLYNQWVFCGPLKTKKLPKYPPPFPKPRR